MIKPVVNQEIYSKYGECQKMFTNNRKLLTLIGEDESSYIAKRINCVERFINQKMHHLDILHESTTLAQLNGALQVGLAVKRNIQLENPANLEHARNTIIDVNGSKIPCYYEDDDYIYYWEPTKHQYNVENHDLDLYTSIKIFNTAYSGYFYIKTIKDSMHTNTRMLYPCVDGNRREETNYLRFIYYLDETDYETVIRIAYNVRVSVKDDKYVVKFTSVFDNSNVPRSMIGAYGKIRRLARKEIMNEIEEDPAMKFRHYITGEILDLSEDKRSVTLDDLRSYECLDEDGFKMKIKMIFNQSRSSRDHDKIIAYKDILPDGKWPNYYMDKVLTDEEYSRREKYYESNRIVFNEQLDKKRANNPNFVKMFKERFNAAKNAIVYGAPQKTVRAYMAKLYGDQVLDLLVKEDPQDTTLDLDN